MAEPRECTACGEIARIHGRGYCQRCYGRWHKYGNPLDKRGGFTTAERLARGCGPQLPNGCIPWVKGKIHGYGNLRVNDVNVSTHRLAWELVNGPIPDGFYVDHLCHVPEECDGGEDCPHRACCNVEHLLPGLPIANVASGRVSIRHGERLPFARLTEEQVREIRAHPEVLSKVFAERFRVHSQTVYDVRSGRTWKRLI